MPRVKANATSTGPQYLSPRSSDVILSEIRPIQLKAEALRSINTFLDEFLWNILSTARSLVTDRMKTGVLKILPTSLGKAALLEAEVELKAYWERTSPATNPNIGVNDALDFPLQWSYEVSSYFGVSMAFSLTPHFASLHTSFCDSNAKHIQLSTMQTRISLQSRDSACVCVKLATLSLPQPFWWPLRPCI